MGIYDFYGFYGIYKIWLFSMNSMAINLVLLMIVAAPQLAKVGGVASGAAVNL